MCFGFENVFEIHNTLQQLVGTTKLGGQNQLTEPLVLIYKTVSFCLIFAFHSTLLFSHRFGFLLYMKSCVLKFSLPFSPFPSLPSPTLALRMKIKEVKKENGDKKIIPKKKKPLKLGPIKKKELKKLVLYLKNGADCPCHQLDNLSHHFLIMGRKVKSQYLLTAIHKWDKKNKEFKNFMKKMKNHECPTFQSVFK